MKLVKKEALIILMLYLNKNLKNDEKSIVLFFNFAIIIIEVSYEEVYNINYYFT